MVRVALIACTLSACCSASEEVYHHTQLLQTKVSPQKAEVGSNGDLVGSNVNLHDEAMLFQKSSAITRQWFQHRTGVFSTGHEEVFCKMVYTDSVDVPKCEGCLQTTTEQEFDQEAFLADQSGEFKRLMGVTDECMGETNLLISGCDEAYENVDMFACLLASYDCQCIPQECKDEGAECHENHMGTSVLQVGSASGAVLVNKQRPGGPPGPGAGGPAAPGSGGPASTATARAGPGVQEPDGPPEECMIFYGEDVTNQQCEDCENQCVAEAEQAAMAAYMQCASDPSKMDECMGAVAKAGFNAFFSCADACFGSPNLVKQACDEHFPGASFMKCCECGAQCPECGLDGTCDCLTECMEPNGKKKDSDLDTELLKISRKALGSESIYEAWHQQLMKRLTKAAQVKKQSSDVTDLMQTGKHLK